MFNGEGFRSTKTALGSYPLCPPWHDGIRSTRLCHCLKIWVLPLPAKVEWQLVVGKRGRKECCDVLSSAAGRFPLECANSFVVLEQEIHIDEPDEEEFFL
eukprot:2387379-Amphidinium_carterae.2